VRVNLESVLGLQGSRCLSNPQKASVWILAPRMKAGKHRRHLRVLLKFHSDRYELARELLRILPTIILQENVPSDEGLVCKNLRYRHGENSYRRRKRNGPNKKRFETITH
jgi:hypothetical protein